MILAYLQNGFVFEVIQPFVNDAGEEVPMSDRFPESFLAQCAEIPSGGPVPEQGWTATNTEGVWTFSPYIPPPPSPEQTRAANATQRDILLKSADLAMGPLQDAVEFDIATAAERALLTNWKQYRVAVNRVDLTQPGPTWPTPPVPPDYGVSGSPTANA